MKALFISLHCTISIGTGGTTCSGMSGTTYSGMGGTRWNGISNFPKTQHSYFPVTSKFSIRNEKVSMSENVGYVFLPGTKIRYDYDFGTTTSPELSAKNRYQLALKEDIILLSRNEPLKILYSVCEEKSATCMCTVCMRDEDAFFL